MKPATTSTGSLTGSQRAALGELANELDAIFGTRLWSLVVYGFDANDIASTPLRTLALVERVTFDDLARLLPLAGRLERRGFATPLLLSRHEFERSLDVFPLEYGSIIEHHILIAGDDLLGGIRVAPADRRRGCEQQAKSHLIHLREGFLETAGHPRRVAELIASSAPAFRVLLANLISLETGEQTNRDMHAVAAATERIIGVPAAQVAEVLGAADGVSAVADPTALLALYVEATERIWRHVDGWRT